MKPANPLAASPLGLRPLLRDLQDVRARGIAPAGCDSYPGFAPAGMVWSRTVVGHRAHQA